MPPPPPPPGAMPPITAARVPMEILAEELALTDEQIAEIDEIQQQVRPGPPGFPPAGRQSSTRHSSRTRPVPPSRAEEEEAVRKIEAALTPEQRQALPDLVKTMQALPPLAIPLEVYSILQLSSEQKKELVALAPPPPRPPSEDAARDGERDARPEEEWQAHRELHKKAMALLTSDQKDTLREFGQTHRPPAPPPGMAPPPPPDGEADMPPPGDMEGPPPSDDEAMMPPPPPGGRPYPGPEKDAREPWRGRPARD